MNDPEKFLSRWSRRKRASSDTAPDTAPDAADESAHEEATAPEGAPLPAPADATDPRAARDAKDEPAFDLSKLPSIESITAETDIRAFLLPGVPPALTRAALRRAWVIDPKIRDFIEIAENQWDFTAPGVPGFDLTPPAGDIARMLRDILPSSPEDEAAREVEAQADAPEPPLDTPQPEPHRIVTEPAANSPAQESNRELESAPPRQIAEQPQDDIAAQKNGAPRYETARAPRRARGRAMPR